MTEEQLQFFTDNKVKIQDTFEKYKQTNNFFAVYFEPSGKLYMSFKKTKDFFPTLKISRNSYTLALVLDCSLTFEEQTDSL